MTEHGNASPKTALARLTQALALVVTGAVLYGVTRATPELDNQLGTMAGIGFLLLAGTLLSELLETIGLPHLSGYLLAGIVGGPHVLKLVDHHTVTELAPVNTLALALIALAGGAELRTDMLRQTARSLAVATLFQGVIVLVSVAGLFLVVARYLPFTHGLPFQALLGVALLWGAMSVSRSPSACLGILSQTRAKGPLATFALGFIMLSDVVVVILLAAVMMLARPLITPGGSVSLEDFNILGHELVSSIAVGTTLGLLLAAYLRFVGGEILLILLGIGFALTEGLRYIHIDPLLAFLSAGFVVQNLSGQGQKLLHAVERTGSVVYVVFFATAGAHLDIPLLRQLWPIALTLCAGRAFATFVASRISSRLARDEPAVARWGWSPLISQAGLTLGLSVTIERAFPSFGAGFRSLAIAAVAVNELIGPVLFKLALDRAGETDPTEPEARPSLMPPVPSRKS